MIYVFFAAHWLLCVLFQSLFQHRYAAHRMYTMKPKAERALHLLTALVQGSSYLEPRAYAIMHREHHAFADTERDPHSPTHQPNVVTMMWRTATHYAGYVTRRAEPEERFLGGYPEWPALDRIFALWPTRIFFGAIYALVYWKLATHAWQFALLPLHFVMGPIHGSIVNWFGHKSGYRNFATRDDSRNSLPIDLLTMGELFQNNHHARPASPNFATRAFELDPTWLVMRLLMKVGLIELTPGSRAALQTKGIEQAAPSQSHPSRAATPRPRRAGLKPSGDAATDTASLTG